MKEWEFVVDRTAVRTLHIKVEVEDDATEDEARRQALEKAWDTDFARAMENGAGYEAHLWKGPDDS